MQSNKLINFVYANWHMFLLLGGLVTAFIINEIRAATTNEGEVSPGQLVTMINHEKAVVIDLRSSDQYAGGYIVNSLNIVAKDLGDKKKQFQKYAKRPIVLVSNVDKDYAVAKGIFDDIGHDRVFSLAGGLKGWSDAGMDLIVANKTSNNLGKKTKSNKGEKNMLESKKSPEVIVYSTDTCPYCVQAIELLKQEQIVYKEIKVDVDPELRAKVIELTGRRTVPQIIINGKPIGGFTDLKAMQDSGELASALNS